MVYLILMKDSVFGSHKTDMEEKGQQELENMNVPRVLGFMSADESEQSIPIQELADGVIPLKNQPRSVSHC